MKSPAYLALHKAKSRIAESIRNQPRQLPLFEADELDKLKHLEHPEDLVAHGASNLKHAIDTLHATHKTLIGQGKHVGITTKYDGAPSVVFGHHPQSNKFFVASKSAFNKDPKINYSHEDIRKNHGRGGLADKLHSTLKRLRGAVPSHGVYQGDLMYGPRDKENVGDHVQAKPNTITYGASKASELGKRMASSGLGIVPHTAYHGSDMESSRPKPLHNFSAFRTDHPEVHIISPEAKPTGLTPEHSHTFQKHMNHAEHAISKVGEGFHDAINQHQIMFKSYINKGIRNGTNPSLEGYKKHVGDVHAKQIEKVSSEAGKNKYRQQLSQAIGHVEKNAHHFAAALNIHHHLQAAKNSLLHGVAPKEDFQTTIAGQKTDPEGYVVSRHEGMPLKLVNRREFSMHNFNQAKSWAPKK